jgi:hypothetical protein
MQAVTEQLTLSVDRSLTIQERFDLFHRSHPEVYRRLRALALTAHGRGRRRGSIELFFAILRWEHWISTHDPTSDFKLNDHYTSRYARLLMEREPELDGFFETRELRAR